jgi:hypothetical protein
MLLAATAVHPKMFISILAVWFPAILGLSAWIITLIVVWRAMKAHESIAKSLHRIAEKEQ